MSLGGRVSPWRSAVEEGRSPLGRFRKPEPCFPRTYATWDAKKDENRFGSVKFRLMPHCTSKLHWHQQNSHELQVAPIPGHVAIWNEILRHKPRQTQQFASCIQQPLSASQKSAVSLLPPVPVFASWSATWNLCLPEHRS